MSDWQLLRNYVDTRSEAAFGKLVNKYLKFVYWTCRRDTHDDRLAEDAAQAVFLLLARKAGSISRDVSIPGWLFNASRLVSRNAVRQQARRVKREQEAAQFMPYTESLSEEWMGIEPWLNDALNSLNSNERAAVLLRYFAEMSLQEAALELGVSDKTVSKRVVSAIEKMRRHLRKKDVTTTTAVLAAVLTEQSTHAMPPHFAAALHAIREAATGHAAATAINTPLTALHQGVSLTMQAAKYKALATAVAAISFVAIGVTIPIVRARSGDLGTAAVHGNPGFVLTVALKPVVTKADGNDASDLPFVKSLRQHEEATAHLTFTWDVNQSESVAAIPAKEIAKEVEIARKDAIEQAKIKGITNPAAVRIFVETAVNSAKLDGVGSTHTEAGPCDFIRDGAKTSVVDNLHITQSAPAAVGDATGYTYCEGNLILTAATAGGFRFATAPTVVARGDVTGGVWYSVGDSVRYDLDGPGGYLSLSPEELSLLSGLSPLSLRGVSWRIMSTTPSAFVLEAPFNNSGRNIRITLDRANDNLPADIVVYRGTSDRNAWSYHVNGFTKHGKMWVCSKIACSWPSISSPRKREWVLRSVTDTSKPVNLTLPEFTSMEDYRLLGPILGYSSTYNASRANDPRICIYLWRSKLPTEDKLPTLLRGPGLTVAALRAQTY